MEGTTKRLILPTVFLSAVKLFLNWSPRQLVRTRSPRCNELPTMVRLTCSRIGTAPQKCSWHSDSLGQKRFHPLNPMMLLTTVSFHPLEANLWQAYDVLPINFQQRPNVGDAEKFTDALAQVNQDQLAAGRLGRYIQADDCP